MTGGTLTGQLASKSSITVYENDTQTISEFSYSYKENNVQTKKISIKAICDADGAGHWVVEVNPAQVGDARVQAFGIDGKNKIVTTMNNFLLYENTKRVATQEWVNGQLTNYGLKNTTGSGWWKDSSTGKIYQYGIAPAGSSGTFPIPFPNACEFVMVSADDPYTGTWAPAYQNVNSQDVNGFTTTSQTFRRKFIAIGS